MRGRFPPTHRRLDHILGKGKCNMIAGDLNMGHAFCRFPGCFLGPRIFDPLGQRRSDYTLPCPPLSLTSHYLNLLLLLSELFGDNLLEYLDFCVVLVWVQFKRGRKRDSCFDPRGGGPKDTGEPTRRRRKEGGSTHTSHTPGDPRRVGGSTQSYQ